MPLLTVAVIPDMRPTNRYQELLADALERRGIRVRFPDQFGGRRPLLRAVVSRRFDVLHLDWIHPFVAAGTLPKSLMRSAVFISKLLLARLFGRRIVWTVHNLTGHDARFAGLERVVGRLTAALTHGLLVHYPAAEQIVRSSLSVSPAKEIFVAHHGHYIHAYGDEPGRASQPHPEPSRPLVILSFGLVRRYKRMEELIAASRILHGEEVRLQIRGMARDDEYAEELLRHAEDDDRVDVDLGFVEDESIPGLFAAADVVAATQTDTLTSGSLILAMSMGKPVVAARTPHAEFLLGNGAGGILYTPGDIPELAAALEAMTERREELADMGAANRRAIARYSWASMAEEVQRAYRGSR